jgi:hypothetical protein
MPQSPRPRRAHQVLSSTSFRAPFLAERGYCACVLWSGEPHCSLPQCRFLCVIAVALAVAYPNLPDISELSDYRPKLPLRVFSSEGTLIGEFGEERRNLTPSPPFPKS